jgi:hypothetical protein
MSKQEITLEKWLSHARTLRAEMYRSDARYMLYLVAGEKIDSLWKGAFTSYEQLLKDQELVEPSRYTAFRNALAIVDVSVAEQIGVDGVIRAARVQDAEKRGLCVASMTEWSKAHGHPPSAETCARTVQAIAPVERIPNVLSSALARDKLEAENRSLRARVKELEAANAKLRKELAKLGTTSKKVG